MLDGVSIDQIRVFIAAAEEGSFSAAGRRLNRAQSAVSQAIAALEAQLGVPLFARDGRYPELTKAGRAILGDARLVAREMDALKSRAKAFVGGLEPELSVVADALYPIAEIVEAIRAFNQYCAATTLRLSIESLGGVLQPLIEGSSSFGIIGAHPELVPKGLAQEPLASVHMVTVAAPTHPLATHGGAIIPTQDLEGHTQLVVTDRTKMTSGREFGVVAAKTWRLTDLNSKHIFLKSGLGWGNLPFWMVEADLASGALVLLRPERMPDGAYLPFAAAYRAESPPGPAGRWLIDRLKGGENPPPSKPTAARL